MKIVSAEVPIANILSTAFNAFSSMLRVAVHDFFEWIVTSYEFDYRHDTHTLFVKVLFNCTGGEKMKPDDQQSHPLKYQCTLLSSYIYTHLFYIIYIQIFTICLLIPTLCQY